jgi:hypothetical protein
VRIEQPDNFIFAMHLMLTVVLYCTVKKELFLTGIIKSLEYFDGGKTLTSLCLLPWWL